MTIQRIGITAAALALAIGGAAAAATISSSFTGSASTRARGTGGHYAVRVMSLPVAADPAGRSLAEPASIVLFGSVLLGLRARLRSTTRR